MSDKATPKIGYDTPEEAAEAARKWVESGKPLHVLFLDPPFTGCIADDGGMAIEWPGATLGRYVGTVRLNIDPAAIKGLHELLGKALAKLESQGGPPVTVAH